MCIKLINLLQEKCKAEAKIKKIEAQETKIAKRFAKICPTTSFPNISSLSPEMFEHLKNHSEFIFLYIEYIVNPEIKYWKSNIRNNAQNMASMFASFYTCTGTPYNDGAYPAGMEMLRDPGTLEDALGIITKKCPENPVHKLTKSEPKDILQEILQKFFSRKESDFTALIDGGAQLKGLHNIEVARTMLEFVRKLRPDIMAIDFFLKDEEGKDILSTIQVNSPDPIPYDLCKIPPEARLAYFDQRHGFAANIPQKFNGRGLVLLGENHTLYRLLQEIFRMRGIKVFMRLIGADIGIESPEDLEKVNKENTQSVEFAVTDDVQAAISGPRLPTLRDIIAFCRKNEADLIERINYNSCRQKIDNVIRREILDKIYEASSVNNMLSLLDEFYSVLISHVEDDPQKLFGLIEVDKITSQVVEQAVEKAYDVIKNSSSFTTKEKKRIYATLLSIIEQKHPMPETVTVSTDGKSDHLEVGDDFGKQVSVEAEHDHEDEDENENENENELETSLQQQLPQSGYFREWEWSDKISPYTRDWIQFSPYADAIGTFVGGKWESMKTLWARKKGKITGIELPPLFSVVDVAANSSVPDCTALAKAIDKRLWFTNNFLPTVTRYRADAAIEFPSISQRELVEVLVFADEDEDELSIHSVGCLSQHDAEQWRELFKKHKGAMHLNQRVFLYDTRLRVIVAGNQIDRAKLIKNHDFQELEAQLKFMHGDFDFPDEMMEVLTNWLSRHDIKSMENGFRAIHAERCKKSFEGSALDILFANLRKKKKGSASPQ